MSMNLFLELRRHGRLADKRHPMYEKSRFARFWMYFVAVFWAGYLIFIGTMLAFGFEDAAVEPYHLLNSGLVFILALAGLPDAISLPEDAHAGGEALPAAARATQPAD